MAGKRKRCPCVLCHNARLQPGAKRGKRLDADVVAEHVDAWGLPTEYDADSDYMSFSDAGSDDNSTGSPDAAPAAAADEDDAPQASPQAPAPSQPLSPSAQANDAPHMLPPAVGGPRGLCDAFLADRNRRLAAADVTYNECGGNVRDVCLGVLHNMVSSKGTYAQLLRELNGHRKYRGAHALPETIDEVIGIVLPEWPRRADFDCCQRCGRTAFVDADWAPLPPKQHANCSVPSCFAERHQLRGRGDGVFVLAKPAFHTVDIAMQLWILFSRPDISAMLNTVAPRSDGLITSIQDGALWQQVVALKRSANAGELVCAWALFVDGISPFGMSWTSYSSTPIMLECLDLPAAMRRKPENLILAAVTKGPTKIKDLQVVFRELAQRLNRQYDGGVEVRLGHLPVAAGTVLMRPVVLCTKADGVGQAEAHNLYGASAISACLYCQAETTAREGGRGRVFSGARCRLPPDHWMRTDPTFVEPENREAPALKTAALRKSVARRISAHEAAGDVKAADELRQMYGVRGAAALHDLHQPFPVEPVIDLMHNAANVDKLTVVTLRAAFPEACDGISSQLQFFHAPGEFPRNAVLNLAHPERCVMLKSHDRLVRLTSGVLTLAYMGNVPSAHHAVVRRLCSVYRRLAASVAPRDKLEQLELETNELLSLWELLMPDSAQTLQLHIAAHLGAEQLRKFGPACELWTFVLEAAFGDLFLRQHSRSSPEPAAINAFILRAALLSSLSVSQTPNDATSNGGVLVCRFSEARFHGRHQAALLDDASTAARDAALRRLLLPAAVGNVCERYDNARVHDLNFRNAARDNRFNNFNAGMQVAIGDHELFGVAQAFEYFAVAGGNVGLIAFRPYISALAVAAGFPAGAALHHQDADLPCIQLENGAPVLGALLYVAPFEVCGQHAYVDTCRRHVCGEVDLDVRLIVRHTHTHTISRVLQCRDKTPELFAAPFAVMLASIWNPADGAVTVRLHADEWPEAADLSAMGEAVVAELDAEDAREAEAAAQLASEPEDAGAADTGAGDDAGAGAAAAGAAAAPMALPPTRLIALEDGEYYQEGLEFRRLVVAERLAEEAEELAAQEAELIAQLARLQVRRAHKSSEAERLRAAVGAERAAAQPLARDTLPPASRAQREQAMRKAEQDAAVAAVNALGPENVARLVDTVVQRGGPAADGAFAGLIIDGRIANDARGGAGALQAQRHLLTRYPPTIYSAVHAKFPAAFVTLRASARAAAVLLCEHLREAEARDE